MLIKNLNVNIHKKEVLDSLDCYEGNPLYKELSEEYDDWLKKVRACIDACALFCMETIPDMDGLNRQLIGKEAVYVLLSLGEAVTKLSEKQIADSNYLTGMLIAAMADNYLFHMEEALSETFSELCRERKRGILKRLEAPYGVPMEFQRVIWEAVKGYDVGITINESFMLKPLKSLTYVLVLTRDTTKFQIAHDCRSCGNTACKMRRTLPVMVTVNHTQNYTQDGTQSINYECMAGESLLELLRKKDILLTSPCGGKGTCGKCRIRLVQGTLAITEADRQFLTKEELEAGVRLACKAYPKEDCVICTDIGIEADYKVLSDFQKSDTVEVQTSDSLESEERSYGIGIDIGTTTIAMQLVALPEGRRIDSYAALNRQRSYGADVISRMEASNAGLGMKLQESIRENLKEGIEKLCEHADIKETELSKITIAGNTTMLHLLCGYSCETLGVYPFTPVSLERFEDHGEVIGLYLPDTAVVLYPGISTFVGGDIAAGLLACEFDRSEQVSMLIDLGTNGEMAIGNQSRILCTSTAAGPAFEGGNISCGVGSVPGAVCGMELIGDRAVLQTIGDETPCGICGTGIVEAVYELLKIEVIDETGRMTDACFETGFSFGKMADGRALSVTQKDIREFQLAKAAIRAGIEILVRRYEITYEQIAHVYLAGGFGYQMNIQKAVAIGLFPKALEKKLQSVGNSALKGAVLDMTERSAAVREQELIAGATELSLSEYEEFQELYMNYMFFETD